MNKYYIFLLASCLTACYSNKECINKAISGASNDGNALWSILAFHNNTDDLNEKYLSANLINIAEEGYFKLYFTLDLKDDFYNTATSFFLKEEGQYWEICFKSPIPELNGCKKLFLWTNSRNTMAYMLIIDKNFYFLCQHGIWPDEVYWFKKIKNLTGGIPYDYLEELPDHFKERFPGFPEE